MDSLGSYLMVGKSPDRIFLRKKPPPAVQAFSSALRDGTFGLCFALRKHLPQQERATPAQDGGPLL